MYVRALVHITMLRRHYDVNLTTHYKNAIERIILVYLLQLMKDESQLVHKDGYDNVGQMYNKKGHVEALPKAGSVDNKP